VNTLIERACAASAACAEDDGPVTLSLPPSRIHGPRLSYIPDLHSKTAGGLRSGRGTSVSWTGSPRRHARHLRATRSAPASPLALRSSAEF